MAAGAMSSFFEVQEVEVSSHTEDTKSEEPAEVGPVALRWEHWANLIAYVINIGITYISLTGIFGRTNTELSAKYQTLVTPAGWAFAIWGPIFIWEGVFAVAQITCVRGSSVIGPVTPWWLLACGFQVAWTVFFAQEVMVGALICMLGILACLLGGVIMTDRLPEITTKDFWLLRAPLSLHCGWIVAASAVNANVLADYLRASPEVMLAMAVASLGGIAAVVLFFSVGAPRADAIIPLVAAWALWGVASELGQAENLRSRGRFNFYEWPQVVLDGLALAALVLSVASLALAALAAGRRLLAPGRPRAAAAEGQPFRA